MVSKPDFSSHAGPHGLCRQMTKRQEVSCNRRSVCHSLILPLICLTFSHGHRKANPTGPPQVVISPGFLNKSQYRAQSLLQRNCWLVLPRRYLQQVEVESFALVDTWQTYASCIPLSPPDPSQICIFAAGSGKSVLWLVALYCY
jgi:hypothetical protein